MSTVIITGSRDWTDGSKLSDCLDIENMTSPITLLVQGGARGADHHALRWATINGIKCITVHADWDQHGKAAGPIRNIEMLDGFPYARVIAFPLGKSIGTRHCMREAVKRGIKVTNYGDK
jgi:hypothetical protein